MVARIIIVSGPNSLLLSDTIIPNQDKTRVYSNGQSLMADMAQFSMVVVFAALIFLTWRDLTQTEQADTHKDIKAPKLALATPTIKFLFWYKYNLYVFFFPF